MKDREKRGIVRHLQFLFPVNLRETWLISAQLTFSGEERPLQHLLNTWHAAVDSEKNDCGCRRLFKTLWILAELPA